jgi:hypothetical protein
MTTYTEDLSPNERAVPLWFIFLDPAATLESLRRHARIVAPLLIAATLGTAANYYVLSRVGLRRLIEAAAAANVTIDRETFIANAMAQSTQIMTMQGLGSFFGSILSVLGLALIYYLLVLVAGGDVTMKRVIAVVAHSTFAVAALRYSMIAMTATFGNPEDFMLLNPIGTNLGFYLRLDSEVLQKLITAFDVLTIAGMALTVIGLRKVSDALPASVAVSVVAGPWVLYVTAALWLPWLGLGG